MPTNSSAVAREAPVNRIIEAPADKPVSELELEIGRMVAQAAILVCAAVEEYREGRSTLAINTQAATLTAKLYELRQAAPDIDLARAGKRELRRILGPNIGVAEACCRQRSLDEVLETIVSWPLGVLAQVTADEQDRLRSQ
jgi:hypothetical protein